MIAFCHVLSGHAGFFVVSCSSSEKVTILSNYAILDSEYLSNEIYHQMYVL